jgi:hypothetical protein
MEPDGPLYGLLTTHLVGGPGIGASQSALTLANFTTSTHLLFSTSTTARNSAREFVGDSAR